MSIEIPAGVDSCEVRYGTKKITLTNLNKIFWPQLGKTKRDLLTYYVEVASALLPHLRDRAMLMKRYPDGIEGKFFFMKPTPLYRPNWLKTCAIPHKSGKIIDFPVAQDLASLLWIVNLGCIDLNPWYARCDDIDRPDFLNFDLDPVSPAGFPQVCEAALLVKNYLDQKKVQSCAKTSGSRGIHVYIPIQRKAIQKEVWRVAKRVALELARLHPNSITSESRVAQRPAGRILVDYNQNAWGRALVSVYSVRPNPEAAVSAPVTWKEIERGFDIEDFTMDTVPARIAVHGDLFESVLHQRSRCPLESLQ